MGIAVEEANKSNLKLDILEKVLENYKMLEADGNGSLGTQALIKHYQ